MSHPINTSPHFHRPDVIKQTLYVITPVMNPQRYRTRWKLYKEFEKYVLDSQQAHLVTIECAFGEREFVIEQQPSHHTVVQVRSSTEAWLKENMINIAISRLPLDSKYIAWIDADISFARKDWVGETLHLLQHYDVIQMFSEAIDLGPKQEITRVFTGFNYCYSNPYKVPTFDKKNYVTHKDGKGYWHPGFAWAARKEAINHLGGLVDWSILGGGDTFMAYALSGLLSNRTMPRSLGPSGVAMLQEWEQRAEKYVRRNIGYMEGTIFHYWHGSRKSRAYMDRGAILTTASFDPIKDIKKDWQGLYQLNPENILLRDGIRKYFRQRNEDSIDY